MDKPSLRGLATGIGSLPYKDADAALSLVFECTPEIPFWPQLPKRDIREGMVAQFTQGLPCLRVSDRGVIFDGGKKEEELGEFYEKIINKDLDYFKITPDFALGLYAFKDRLSKVNLKLVKEIKCHVVGPFTFAASLKDEKGNALLHSPEMMQAITEGLVMKALWQVKFFEQFGKSVILFIDEPYLGCFGSAYTPINREDVVRVLGDFTQRIKASGAVRTGVHCCGNTDWSIFTDIPALDIINFDAFSYLDKLLLYAEDLRKFFSNAKILCWGIVPTQDFDEKISSSELIEKLNYGIDVLIKKGVDKHRLSENLLLSPACGLGMLGVEQAEKIFRLLSKVSGKIREKESV